MGALCAAKQREANPVEEEVEGTPTIITIAGATGYRRIKNPVNQAKWDILFLELIEAQRDLTGKSMTKLWDRYDTSGKGHIGKPQLKKFLLDWVHVIQRHYVNAIDEDTLFHFHETADERAYRAKNFLDKTKRGRVTFGDFKRINDEEFWKLVSHEVLIDVRLEGIRMWREVFRTMEASGGCLAATDILRIWNRYETKESGNITVEQIERLLKDWIEASFVHYSGRIQLEQLEHFLATVKSRAVMAHVFLDSNHDGLVEYEEFTGIQNPTFWQQLDHNKEVDSRTDVEDLKREHLKRRATVTPDRSPTPNATRRLYYRLTSAMATEYPNETPEGDMGTYT